MPGGSEPIRVLPEPPSLPEVERPVSEPLVRAADSGIAVVPVYHEACLPGAVEEVWLRSEVVARLAGVTASLPRPFGLVVFDGWRPLTLQRWLHADAVARVGTAVGFVSEAASDPRRPPPHLTGGAVDLTLSVEGEALALGTCFDAFVPEAAPDAFEGRPGAVRALRRLLHEAMTAAGFVPLATEWWHFEYGTPRWAALRGGDPLYGPASPP